MVSGGCVEPATAPGDLIGHCQVYRQDTFDRPKLEKESLADDDVHSVTTVNAHVFIGDGQRNFSFQGRAVVVKRPALVIDGFQRPRVELLVRLDGQTDDPFGVDWAGFGGRAFILGGRLWGSAWLTVGQPIGRCLFRVPVSRRRAGRGVRREYFIPNTQVTAKFYSTFSAPSSARSASRAVRVRTPAGPVAPRSNQAARQGELECQCEGAKNHRDRRKLDPTCQESGPLEVTPKPFTPHPVN